MFQETTTNYTLQHYMGLSTNGFKIALLSFPSNIISLHLFYSGPKHLILLGKTWIQYQLLSLLSSRVLSSSSLSFSASFKQSSLTSCPTNFWAMFSIIHPPTLLKGQFHLGDYTIQNETTKCLFGYKIQCFLLQFQNRVLKGTLFNAQ